MKFYDILRQEPLKEICYHRRFEPADGTVELKEGSVFIQEKRPFRYVRLTWETPSLATDAVVMGDAFERGYGELFWGKADEKRKLFWYMAVSDRKETFGYGVKTGCSAFCYWVATENTLQLVLDCQNGTLPVLLNGRRLHACDVVEAAAEKETPFVFMQRFCRMMCPSPRLPKSPVYGTNTWYYAFTSTSFDLVKQDVALLDECTKGLENRPYMVIDDGWEAVNMNLCRHRKIDLWQADGVKFRDMKEAADYIKAHGQKPGVWIRFLIGTGSLPRSWSTTKYAFFDNIALDPSKPEVLEYVAKLTKRVIGWGYELIKHDFSTFDVLRSFGSDYYKCKRRRKFFDRTRTTAEIILDFYRTIRKAAGDAVIIGCNTVSHLSAGLFEMERIGDDTSPKDWNRVVKMGVNSLAFRAFQQNIFYGCDADCVGHTGQIPWEKNRNWLKLLAISGTPLLTSIDPRKVTDEIKKDLKEAYALAEKQERVAEPVNWFDDAFPEEWKLGDERYHFDFSR